MRSQVEYQNWIPLGKIFCRVPLTCPLYGLNVRTFSAFNRNIWARSEHRKKMPKLLKNKSTDLQTYRKDTEPFISCFHVLTSITSFQYLSIHAMTFIARYSYMLFRYLIGITKSSIMNRQSYHHSTLEHHHEIRLGY